MSRKTLLTIAALLVIIVAVLAMVRRLETRKGGQVAAAAIVQALKGIPAAEVSEVEVSGGEESVKLVKQDGRWTVNGKRMDADQVEQALISLQDAHYTGPVSRARQNFDKLDVGDKGLRVTFTAGDRNVQIHIGKSGPTYDSSYVRLEGSDETYVANKSLRYSFAARQDFWQSKKVIDINPEHVARITIREAGRDKETYQKEGESWLSISGITSTTTDEAVIKSILNAAHPLTASGFVVEEKDVSAFEKEKGKATILELLGTDGNALAAVTLLKRESEWWARAEGNNQIYRLLQYAVEALQME